MEKIETQTSELYRQTEYLLVECRNLYDLGFSLIPLRPCSKIPLIGWAEFQTQRAPWAQVQEWMTTYPDANIGIVTGNISGLVVIDFDTQEAFEEACNQGWLENTVLSETGRGFHAYYHVPDQVFRSRTALLPHVDVRGEGGFVVAPPSIHESRKAYRWLDDPNRIRETQMSDWLLERLLTPVFMQTPTSSFSGMGTLALERGAEKVANAPIGTRNDVLNDTSFALGQLARQGVVDQSRAIATVTDAALRSGLPQSEVERTVSSGFGAGLVAPFFPRKDLSEDYIAQTFTEMHQHDAKFCHTTGKWYGFNGVYWAVSETGTERNILREIARLQSGGKASYSKNSVVSGAENLAKNDPAHAVTSEYWDSDPYLLGTPGGTVDLRSGELRQARPEEGITKVTACAPENGQPDLWLRFLRECVGGDEEMVAYLQRLCGYALTGDTCEHALFFIHGYGGNGKSVFLNTAAGISADYATTASMDTFTAKGAAQHTTDLAMLKGARLVTASETEAGQPWAEARIKQMTGGDKITARFMRQDFFTFSPQFKLLIVGNHAPKLTFVDDAIRRRFNILPFIRKPQNPDKHLEQRLKGEWGQILNWMIEGCRKWQEEGLNPPPAVLAATEEFFDEQDVFEQWIKAKCYLDSKDTSIRTPCKAAYSDWLAFAEENGEQPKDPKLLGVRLKRRGIESKSAVERSTGEKVKHYIGLRLI